MAAGSSEPKPANGKDEANNMVNGNSSVNSSVNLKAKITGLPSSYCSEVSY